MKIPTSRRRRGFTLVELLVVIAIIAVLAAAGFAAGTAAIQKAKKVTCQASCSGVETAVNNFFTEYGSMPSTGDQDVTEETDKKVALITVLLGLETPSSTMLNTRGVKFLSVKEGKNKKNGLIYSTNGTAVSGLFDPWGGGLKVRMDLDFDERVTVKPSGAGAKEVTLNRRVAVWSDGADGVKGGGKTGDDVITWQ